MNPDPPAFAFGRLRADRSDPLRDDPDALQRLWPQARVLLIDHSGAAVSRIDERGEGLYLPYGHQCASNCAHASFLGCEVGGQAWFALTAEGVQDIPVGRFDLRRAAGQLDPEQAGLFAYARALLHWQQRSRHCSQCGAPLTLTRAGHLARCGSCGAEFYPRTDPAVIVLVSDGERALLGRQASWPARRYSVLAGFVEPGERLEDAIVREVMEEAGVRVTHSRYVASQPWPFPSALMIGFRAMAEPDEPSFGSELEDARWFSPGQLVQAVSGGELLLSPRISIARRLIEDWLAEHGVAAPDSED